MYFFFVVVGWFYHSLRFILKSFNGTNANRKIEIRYMWYSYILKIYTEHCALFFLSFFLSLQISTAAYMTTLFLFGILYLFQFKCCQHYVGYRFLFSCTFLLNRISLCINAKAHVRIFFYFIFFLFIHHDQNRVAIWLKDLQFTIAFDFELKEKM